jgi:hypothetical protein
MKVPEGYRLIAHSDLRYSTTKVYHNPDSMLFVLMVDETFMGYFTKSQIESLSHAAADVITMRDKFNYLD